MSEDASRRPKARRGEAQRVIRRLGDLVVRHRTNDRKGSHVTHWLSEQRRVEWWPGAARWRDPEGRMHRGSAADLVAFLRAEQPNCTVKISGVGT